MPEGHTIHRAARDHQRDLGGQRVEVSSPQGRFDAAALADADGRARLERVEAWGKHLLYRFDGDRVVHVHLGLFGRFYRRRNPAPAPRPTTRLRLVGAAITLDLVGPTACELLTPAQVEELLGRLGPDPLRAADDPEAGCAGFVRYVTRSSAPIGAILMDQARIAGIGNVYRAELLHILRLHPDLPGAAIPADTVAALWQLAADLLRRGVEERRIVTTRGAGLTSPRERVPRGERTHVYGRRTCLTCGGDVRTWSLRGRVVYGCEACQPPPAVQDAATGPDGSATARARPGRSR